MLALPAIAALAEACRERALVLVARRAVSPLFSGLPGVSAVVRAGRGVARLAAVRRALGAERPAMGVERPALAIVFPHSFGAAAELAAARPRSTWGYGGPLRRLALDVALPPRWLRGRHRWETYALLAAAATGRPVRERYPIAIGPGDRAAADLLFGQAGLDGPAPVVGLVPGTHATSRRWPAPRFAALASALGRDGARVVIFGSEADRDLGAAIATLADPAPRDLTGRTPLPVLAECFRRLALLVTNDTGPMHLAAAVGTAIIDLCGAADEATTGPRGSESEVLVHPIHCRPCVKNTCAYNLGCMTGIPVSEVLARARTRLEGSRSTRGPL